MTHSSSDILYTLPPAWVTRANEDHEKIEFYSDEEEHPISNPEEISYHIKLTSPIEIQNQEIDQSVE